MARKSPSKNVFVLTLPLQCEAWQRDRLDTIFQVGNDIKNNLIAYERKQYQNLISRKDWRANQAALSAAYEAEDAGRIKALCKRRNEMLTNAGFEQFQFEKQSTESTTVERMGKDSLSRPMWRRRLPLLCGAVIKSSCTGVGNRSASLNGVSSAPSLRRRILQGFDTQMVSFSSRECSFMCYSTRKTHTATSRRRRRELSGIAESIVAGMLADGSISSSLRWMDYLH